MNPEFPRGLPAELAALDAELSSLRIEERPSFGPELEAELRSAAQTGDAPPASVRRFAVAASVALLLVAGAAFPARAALVALMERLNPPPVPAEPPRIALPTPPAMAPIPVEPVPAKGLLVPPRPAPAPVRTVAPRVQDLEEQQRMIRRFYPQRLQRSGVGGIVNVLAWVDTTGAVGSVEVRQSSGHPEIDRAALAAAPRLTFRPAMRGGRPVSTWVQFDLVFAPDEDELPMRRLDPAAAAESAGAGVPAAWTGTPPVPPSTLREAGALLAEALADDARVAELGTADRILLGEPPAGADPLLWREGAVSALEGAIAHAPDNPAPVLALARILRKQGLQDEALRLLEGGVAHAERQGTVSPRLLAELHYEVGTTARQAWRARANLGRLPAAALGDGSCPRAGVSRRDPVPTATLIAWNYLCPAELSRLLAERFEPDPAADAEHETMRRSLYSALAADPGHVGANVELLLDLAESGDPRRLLNMARRFAYASRGHPYARLLSGLALHRIGRSEDALAELEAGLSGLAPEEADRIRDVRPLLDSAEAARFSGLRGDERADAEARFWGGLDPLVSTFVNERRVAHLARGVYAHLRLGGSATEAGDLWIRYGEPVAIRVVGEGSEIRTELWDYGQGPAVTLSRAARSSALELTPEGRAYLDDLRATRRHTYGSGGRIVDDLSVRLERFAAEEGTGEIEVATSLPEALLSGADTLTLSVIQLDAAGVRVSSGKRVRVAPGGEGVRVRVPVEDGASTVAVEVFNPSLGRAAAARLPVPGAEGVAGLR